VREVDDVLALYEQKRRERLEENARKEMERRKETRTALLAGRLDNWRCTSNPACIALILALQPHTPGSCEASQD
jgi:hypothetical protein